MQDGAPAKDVLVSGVHSPTLDVTYVPWNKVAAANCIAYWKSPYTGDELNECKARGLGRHRQYCVELSWATLVEPGRVISEPEWRERQYGNAICNNCEAAMQNTRAWCEPIANTPVVRVALASSVESLAATAELAMKTSNNSEKTLTENIAKVENTLKADLDLALAALLKRVDALEAFKSRVEAQSQQRSTQPTPRRAEP
jgi:hypothetical protein